jgi:transposase InsO family protein
MKAQKILPGAKTISRLMDISPEAKRRLRWMDWCQAHGRNARLTCRHFAISPDTFYRWKRRYKTGCLKTLEGLSTKPKTFRKSTIPQAAINLVISLRKKNMGCSKYKIHQLLKRDHEVKLSPSSIGRILERKGLIKEANLSRAIKRRKRVNYAIPRIRAAKQLRYKRPGHLVQVDTKHLIVLGRTYYQFTAIDCYTRLSFSRVYTKGASASGQDFLRHLIKAVPFKIKAVQTDNGSEYLLYFHRECIKQNIIHYFSHPKTPKDNPLVERLIQSTEYELWLFDETLIPELDYLNQKVSWWIGRYNTYRPHQSLNYQTPMEYYQKQGGKVYGR